MQNDCSIICYYTLLPVYLLASFARTTRYHVFEPNGKVQQFANIKICDRHINHEINDGGVTTYYSFK